jgi:hypothetical protein
MSETELILPTVPTMGTSKSPRNLIIFSKPKTGKTELAAQLPNSLIIDLEEGSEFVKAMRMKASNVQEIAAIAKAIKAAGFPYDYAIVDTVTALEDMCVAYAEELYSKSPMGKYWFNAKDSVSQSGREKYGTILGLPDGAGYHWLRLAFDKMIALISKLAPRIVLLAHVKDVVLNKEENDFTSEDLDLTGKIKRSLASHCDSIGYLYRKKNQNILSFKSSDKVACGARPKHLSNQEIVVSEQIDGEIVTHWDRIFID